VRDETAQTLVHPAKLRKLRPHEAGSIIDNSTAAAARAVRSWLLPATASRPMLLACCWYGPALHVHLLVQPYRMHPQQAAHSWRSQQPPRMCPADMAAVCHVDRSVDIHPRGWDAGTQPLLHNQQWPWLQSVSQHLQLGHSTGRATLLQRVGQRSIHEPRILSTDYPGPPGPDRSISSLPENGHFRGARPSPASK
jgi:hypothetical protein